MTVTPQGRSIKMVFPFAVNCLAGRLVRPYALSQQVCSGPQIASFRRAKRNRPCFSSPTVVAGLRSVAYAICHAGTSRKTRPDFTYSFHFHDRGIFTIPAFSEMDRRKRGAAIHRILLDNLDRAGELLECRKVKNPMCKTASAISKKSAREDSRAAARLAKASGLSGRDAGRLAASIVSDPTRSGAENRRDTSGPREVEINGVQSQGLINPAVTGQGKSHSLSRSVCRGGCAYSGFSRQTRH